MGKWVNGKILEPNRRIGERENRGGRKRNGETVSVRAGDYPSILGRPFAHSPIRPFLLLLWILLLIPAITRAHTVGELSNKSDMFHQQAVTVIGEVHDVVTRYGEKPYTTFVLYDAQDNVLPVFTWGTPTFKQGQFCRVAGTFFSEKPFGAFVLKRGIEAATVAKLSDSETTMESTVFKKKKRTGIRGARGFYIPQ
jgi:hypothetical protein